jgi:hypothetical protein
MYITLSPQHVSSTTALISRRSQLYYAPSGMPLPTGCHATHWLKVNKVIYILQNKKLGASSWSQKIDLHHDARSEKHKKDR